MTLIPLDRKQLILEDAKERILENHTLEQIAQSLQSSKLFKENWIKTTTNMIPDRSLRKFQLP